MKIVENRIKEIIENLNNLLNIKRPKNKIVKWANDVLYPLEIIKIPDKIKTKKIK